MIKIVQVGQASEEILLCIYLLTVSAIWCHQIQDMKKVGICADFEQESAESKIALTLNLSFRFKCY